MIIVPVYTLGINYNLAAPVHLIKMLSVPVTYPRSQTERSRRRIKASQRSLKARDKQVTKFLQSKILEQVYGETGDPPPPAAVVSDPPDMYQLPPLPENTLIREGSPTPLSRSVDHTHQVKGLDIHSEDFKSLPPEVQHELLLERQQLDTHTHHHPDTLPQVNLKCTITKNLDCDGILKAHKNSIRWYI